MQIADRCGSNCWGLKNIQAPSPIGNTHLYLGLPATHIYPFLFFGSPFSTIKFHYFVNHFAPLRWERQGPARRDGCQSDWMLQHCSDQYVRSTPTCCVLKNNCCILFPRPPFHTLVYRFALLLSHSTLLRPPTSHLPRISLLINALAALLCWWGGGIMVVQIHTRHTWDWQGNYLKYIKM